MCTRARPYGRPGSAVLVGRVLHVLPVGRGDVEKRGRRTDAFVE
jgi:hypothetical protein